MYTKEKTIRDRREQLRVKIKSLAAESKIIRTEERRTYGILRDELRNHRVLEVRSEARSAHVAYGLIRGRTMQQMEPKSVLPPNWKRVKELCKKFGPWDIDVDKLVNT